MLGTEPQQRIGYCCGVEKLLSVFGNIGVERELGIVVMEKAAAIFDIASENRYGQPTRKTQSLKSVSTRNVSEMRVKRVNAHRTPPSLWVIATLVRCPNFNFDREMATIFVLAEEVCKCNWVVHGLRCNFGVQAFAEPGSRAHPLPAL